MPGRKVCTHHRARRDREGQSGRRPAARAAAAGSIADSISSRALAVCPRAAASALSTAHRAERRLSRTLGPSCSHAAVRDVHSFVRPSRSLITAGFRISERVGLDQPGMYTLCNTKYQLLATHSLRERVSVSLFESLCKLLSGSTMVKRSKGLVLLVCVCVAATRT